MKQIPLTKGHFALVDDADYYLVSQFKWTYDNNGYAVRKITLARKRYKKVLLHRWLTNAQLGQMVDHKDGNKLNNCRYNLRVCNGSQNNANRQVRPQTISHYRGVRKSTKSKGWFASIGHNYKTIYLGSFATPEEAARAYDAKAKELFGEFALTNFP